jgi:TolC family type I secretion outer membrane protein
VTPLLFRLFYLVLALILETTASAEFDVGKTLSDPFSTGASVANSSGQQHFRDSERDPCIASAAVSHQWTLVEVIDTALCRNPKTRQAWANARVQAAQVGVSQAAYLPSLSVTANASRSANTASSLGGNQSFGSAQAGVSSLSSREQFRVFPQISLNYLLFDFGGREAKLDNARLALEAANWTQDATIQQIMLAAIQAYYQVFATQAAVDSARTALASSDEALKAADVRHEVGTVALADALQAKTAYAQAKLNLQKAEGDSRIAAGTLANAMGMQADQAIQIEPPTLAEPDQARDDDVHRLIEQAKSLRPDLAAAESQVKAAEANVSVARSSSLPTVSMVGNYGYNYSSVLNNSESWSIGLQLNVPLFTGFANTYQIRAAEEQVAVQKAGRDQLDQAVALDVWRAYHQLNTTRETLVSSGELVASASQSEAVALGRYKAGAGNVLDLLNAQSSLANARMQNIQALYDWLTQKAVLAQAIGRLGLDRLESR